MNEIDRAALLLAIKRARAIDAEHAAHIDAMLEGRDWVSVALFASCSCQCDALNLPPYQSPPAELPSDYDPSTDNEPFLGRREAFALLQRMLACGVSRFDPDPLAAIAAAKRKSPAS